MPSCSRKYPLAFSPRSPRDSCRRPGRSTPRTTPPGRPHRRPAAHDGAEVAAGAVAAHREPGGVAVQRRSIVGHPPRRCETVVHRGGVAELGSHAVVDRDHDASASRQIVRAMLSWCRGCRSPIRLRGRTPRPDVARRLRACTPGPRPCRRRQGADVPNGADWDGVARQLHHAVGSSPGSATGSSWIGGFPAGRHLGQQTSA